MSSRKSYAMFAGAEPEIFRFAEKLRTNMTNAERKLWDYLKKKPHGLKFRRQHPFNKYILDFYCHKAKLAIELDGLYHLSISQKKLDQERTNVILGLGVKELRFINSEVLENIDLVLDEVLSCCLERI